MMKMNELTINLIEEENFHNAWYRAINLVIRDGIDLTIGGAEYKKPIYDSCMLISLMGNGIKQIERREIHPQYPFKMIDEYCKEFTLEYLEEYVMKPDIQKFPYLYYKRLKEYYMPTWRQGFGNNFTWYDQLEMLKDQLKKQKELGLTSNRNQAITWQLKKPNFDSESTSPPCLQRIQIRYIPENKVDVHFTWRSRDLYATWQSNIICLVDMLNREVIKPNNCHIFRIIDYSDSLHIHKTDIKEAKNVRAVNV